MPKDIYTSRYLFIHDKEVALTKHATIQARRRHIDEEMIEKTIRNGMHKRFGKQLIKFIQPFKDRCVVCIGEDIGSHIIIKTIEWGNAL